MRLIAEWELGEGGGGHRAAGLRRRGSRRWGLAPFLLGPTRTRARVSAPPCDAAAGVRCGDVGEPGTAPAWPAPMNATRWQGTGELEVCAGARGWYGAAPQDAPSRHSLAVRYRPGEG